ncbi:hypothetical protein HK099_005914 [Clydaea vesicula]|uniref:Uncharacterized protein n=1 Tax=Clydaea vesicula TaxID=447962 RepID=A0AAD5TYG7_9FUNG|nr:hypothetical protein HK099_005914 [Clydaea vesicula]
MVLLSRHRWDFSLPFFYDNILNLAIADLNYYDSICWYSLKLYNATQIKVGTDTLQLCYDPLNFNSSPAERTKNFLLAFQLRFGRPLFQPPINPPQNISTNAHNIPQTCNNDNSNTEVTNAANMNNNSLHGNSDNQANFDRTNQIILPPLPMLNNENYSTQQLQHNNFLSTVTNSLKQHQQQVLRHNQQPSVVSDSISPILISPIYSPKDISATVGSSNGFNSIKQLYDPVISSQTHLSQSVYNTAYLDSCQSSSFHASGSFMNNDSPAVNNSSQETIENDSSSQNYERYPAQHSNNHLVSDIRMLNSTYTPFNGHHNNGHQQYYNNQMETTNNKRHRTESSTTDTENNNNNNVKSINTVNENCNNYEIPKTSHCYDDNNCEEEYTHNANFPSVNNKVNHGENVQSRNW